MKTGKVWQVAAVVVLLSVFTSACKKHVPAPPPPPPPPPPAAPSASLTVEPANIEQGQSATLRWSSQNATDASIDPDIGSVDVQGSRTVSPSDSTTYTLNVRGSGGTTQATARLTVTAPPPPPPPPPPAPPQVSLQDQFNQAVKDAFFDFDKSDIRADAKDNLTQSAQFLSQHPNITITVEGHCDERGSTAYNLGLGDRRANAAKDFLVSQGVSGDQIKTISYGKEKPFCTDHDESCWQQNRRAHLVCNNCSE